MAKITKTLSITSVAGGTNGVLSDALSISATKDVTIDGNVSQRIYTVSNDGTSGNATTVASAAGRSIVYLKNKSTSEITISVYTDTGEDQTVAATELFIELKQNEFAIMPAALDYSLMAVGASAGGLLEVAVFTEA